MWVPEARSDMQIAMPLTEIETARLYLRRLARRINLPNVDTQTLYDDPIDPTRGSATTCISAYAGGERKVVASLPPRDPVSIPHDVENRGVATGIH